MTLLPISDDFVHTTLRAVPGLLGKLHYVAGLRGEDGRYAHWGLARVYGQPAAQRTLAEAHLSLFLKVLRAPLKELWEDLRQMAAAEGEKPAVFAQSLKASLPALLPAELGGGSARHFSSVLEGLSTLGRSKRAATHLDA
ncbi:MAG TPA: hypothetical protein VLT85_05215 [Terriglobales bacterium]|nr:hypothetical protein [Terriglobales bacterium]